jgi:hypothetical protein
MNVVMRSALRTCLPYPLGNIPGNHLLETDSNSGLKWGRKDNVVETKTFSTGVAIYTAVMVVWNTGRW